jgi:hypothetical protein
MQDLWIEKRVLRRGRRIERTEKSGTRQIFWNDEIS